MKPQSDFVLVRGPRSHNDNPIGINELIAKHLETSKKFKVMFSSLEEKLKNKSYSDFYNHMKSFMSKTPDGIELLLSLKILR